MERVEISLCSSDEEAAAPSPAAMPVLGKRKGKLDESAATPSAAKKERLQQNDSDGDDDEVLMMDRMPTPATANPVTGGASSSFDAAASAGEGAGEGADEVEYVGHTGDIALADFPHSRENCAIVKFVPGREIETCANCYCYVCDGPASGCSQWAQHCAATHASSHWQQCRRQHREDAAKGPAASVTPRGPVSRPVPWTTERILKAIEQVYPVETAAPPGLLATLRPYQAQSLAHMLHNERSDEPSMCGFVSGCAMGRRGGWLCDEMGMGKTCVCAALILAHRATDKPKAADLADFSTRTNGGARAKVWTRVNGTHYMAYGKSTGFRSPDPTRHAYKEQLKEKYDHRKGEWVTKKELVQDRQADPIPNPEYEAWVAPPNIRFGCTVVLTSCTLLGQWQDELRKWAPSLRVGLYYGAGRDQMYQQLNKFDVVLSTHGSSLFNGFLEQTAFHRLIIDECHLLVGHQAACVKSYDARFVWGVTGTPLSSSPTDLSYVGQILGQWQDGLKLYDDAFIEIKSGARSIVQRVGNFDRFVGKLKKLMIRHTKAQRIGGEAALALPDSAAETVEIDMSNAERDEYDNRKGLRTSSLLEMMRRQSKPKTWVVEMHIASSRMACAGACDSVGSCAKLEWLLTDLASLRASEPAMHAVVFTHFAYSYHRVRKKLVGAGYTVCGFQGNCQPAQRHQTIREFQASIDAVQGGAAAAEAATEAKVFLATTKVGNVGITLTAATRVYLFEPCLDPAMEMQAAGRIHRLGQTRDVLVKRLVYRSSIEESILKLHEEIKAGRLRVVDHLWPNSGLEELLHDSSPDNQEEE